MDFQSVSLVFVLVSLILSISIHEAMHAFTAHWLGDPTAHDEGRITLNPLKHIDLLTTVLLPLILIAMHQPPILAAKPVPFDPSRVKFDEFGSALVGLAGPFSNLLLAGLSAVVIRIVQPDPASLLLEALFTFLLINIGLFVFNMLPIPPLDGSRLLYALAPEPLQKLMYQIEGFGIFLLLPILYIGYPIYGPIIEKISNEILIFLL